MFKELGQLAGLMKNLPQIREAMEKLPQRFAKIVVEAEVGGGMVKAKANGNLEIVGLTISDEALEDREMLEDLIKAAVTQAIKKARAKMAEETEKLMTEVGLPAGMSIPGLTP